MVDIRFIAECVRRHIVVVILALVLGSAAGALTSYISSGNQKIEPNYTAEATLYISGFQQTNSGEYNYQLNEGWLSADAQRIILSDSVSGEVRRALGEDIVISSPSWIDSKTNSAISSHFICVHASADSEELAKDAVLLVVEKAMPLIAEELNVTEVSFFEGPAIVASSGSVNNFGSDPLELNPIAVAVASISWKKVIIFGGMAFVVACAAVVAADFSRKRIRCARDVTRMLGVAVFDSVPCVELDNKGSLSRAASLVDVLCKGNGLKTLFVAEMGDTGFARAAILGLEEELTYARVVGAGSLLSGDSGLSKMHEADCILLVCEKGLKGAQIASSVDYINLSKLPVIGAVYVD